MVRSSGAVAGTAVVRRLVQFSRGAASEGAGRIRSLGVDWGGRPLNPHPELLMLGPDVVYYPELVLSADMEVFLDLTGMAN